MRAHFLQIAALSFCLYHDAFALSCKFKSLTTQYKDADTVFVAEVFHSDVVNSRDGNRAALRKYLKAIEVFKGKVDPEFKLIDEGIYTRVDLPFVKHRELLFLKAGNNLGYCGGSQFLTEDRNGRAAEERMFKKLRRLKTKQSP